MNLQGGSASLQGGNATLQKTANGAVLQNGANPQNFVDPVQNTAVLGENTTVDPATQATQASAAQAAQLRGQITDLVNTVKSIFDSRYGQVDASANEQVGKLNSNFADDSKSLTDQVDQANQQTGAANAGRGTYDSSYRGNAQDATTQAGASQIKGLGNTLEDNIASIAQWVQQQKSGFDANKAGADTLQSQIASETDPSNLVALRNQLDSQITSLQAGNADNNTQAQNMSALEQIAPSSARTVQLQSTLGQIVAGNADPNQKAAIGTALINSAGLSGDDAQKLQAAFQTDLASSSATPQKDPNAPTA